MSCHHEVNLTAYLDGELTGAERSALESHLPGCAECQRTLGLLRHSVATLAALPTFEPSPATRRAVLRRVEAHPLSRTLRLQRLAPRLLMPALGLAAVAVGVFASGHAGGARHRPAELSGETLELAMNLEVAESYLALQVAHLDELEATP